jgi:N-acetylglucosaminyl-diphospho-decaprenol L-rhamnosyltransferase
VVTAAGPVAVLTTVHGRHAHLRRLVAGLAAGAEPPDLQVVVAMGDPAVAGVVRDLDPPWPWVVVEVDVPSEGLPLAAARNRAVREALARGAQVLVLLDVDCIPSPGLVGRYAEVAASAPGPAPRLLCGTVRYLPALGPGEDYDRPHLEAAAPHPARPAPDAGSVVRGTDLMLFWSLSFAVTADDLALVDGFDEAFVGYGGEDTDLAQQVQRAGGSLWWVGGADAFHQHHDSESPPVRHAAAIARNANVFHAKWGWYPMQGWLDALAARGLLEHDDQDGWRPTGA